MSGRCRTLNLEEDRIIELERLANNPLHPAAALHARIVLECTKPATILEIAKKLSINKNVIKKWRDRYESNGIEGLYPQHHGPKPSSSEQLEQKIKTLLTEDTDWTVPELVQRTGGSVPAVKSVLRKLEVTLQRKRLWEYETVADLDEKTVDVVGVYLSKLTRIVVLCCGSSQPLIPGKGIVTTRNRKLARELEKSHPTSLNDFIIAATKHVASGRYGNCRDVASFLDDLLSGLSVIPEMEFRVIVHSIQPLLYRGRHLTNMLPVYIDTEEKWLDEVCCILHLTAKVPNVFAENFSNAVQQFTQASTDESEPFIWKKQVRLPKEDTPKDVPEDVPEKTQSDSQPANK